MNEIGITLTWCAIQVTLVSLVVAGLYVAARRFGPSAGSLIVPGRPGDDRHFVADGAEPLAAVAVGPIFDLKLRPTEIARSVPAVDFAVDAPSPGGPTRTRTDAR